MIEIGAMSFWSRYKTAPKDIINRDFLIMWTLSFLKFKRILKNHTFICDDLSEYIFIDKLGLEYTEVKNEFNNFITKELEWIWGVGKVRAYQVMNKPFFHIDGDVFMNQFIGENILNSDIVVQMPEYLGIHNQVMAYNFDVYRKVFTKLPEIINKFLQGNEQTSFNFGVFGGNDLEFIKKYCDLVFQIIEDNFDNLNNLKESEKSGIRFSVFLEQYIFSCLAKNCYYNTSYFVNPAQVLNDGKILDRRFEHFAGPSKYDSNLKKLFATTLQKNYPKWFDKVHLISDQLNLN